MKWKPRSIAGRAIAIGVLVYASVVVGLAPAAFAVGVRAGDAVPTNPSTNLPVTSGGSSTAWTLKLPAGAACTGDTASSGYHVYSFIVPATTDPGTLTFNPSTGPSSGNPLIDNTGSAYIAANTAAVTGQVIMIPTFNFNLFATTSMGGTKLVTPPGDYKAGIACANTLGQGDKYWSTLFTFTASGSDPNGEVWSVHLDAPVIASGCKSTTTAGAGMGHYPAWPGSQSYLRVACIFNHSTGGTGDFVSSTFTIHDFANAVYHNGAARTLTATSSVIGPPSTITVADCRGIGTWVDRSITGTNIPARTFVTSVSAGCAVANPVPVVGTLTLNKTLTGAVTGTVLVENSNVRSVTDATLAVGSPNITSATANFTAADNGLSISGTNIDGGYVGGVLTVLTATTANIASATITAGVNQTVTIGGTLETTTTRTINDGQFNATNQITSSANAARFQTSDVGLRVSGTGITQPCYILTRNSASLVTLTSACNDGSAGTTKAITIGEPSRTAPTATDTVLNQGAQLPLNPTLVAGSAPCSADQAAGFGIEGTWLNPGSFVGGAFATQPAGTKAIGEILFSTSVINYGAYVVEVPATVDPLIGGAHYNLVFPNVPTTLALCPSTATSPGLGFSIGLNATTASQAAIPTGVGRPDTGQLRSTRATNAGAASTVFITDDVSGPGIKWTGSEFNRFCSVPTGPPVINFVCGPG